MPWMIGKRKVENHADLHCMLKLTALSKYQARLFHSKTKVGKRRINIENNKQPLQPWLEPLD